MRLSLKSLLRKANIDKFLASGGFVFVLVALIVIARTPPATGYELSIYYAYPTYFWSLIIAAIACGIGILIRQAFAAQKSNWWLAGLFLVIFSNSVFLGLPFFRGYAFFPFGDAMTHIGYMKDIIATGHLGDSNYYPVVHILGVDLLTITGLSQATVVNLLFVFFSALYLLNMYLLATVVANRRGQALLITAFACPLIFSFFHARIHPSMFSLFMLPLLLYFYHRAASLPGHKAQNIALLFLVALLMTFFHPITALFAIAVLLVFALASYLHRKLAPATNPGSQLRTSKNSTKFALITAVVMVVFFSSWYLSFPSIRGSFNKVYGWLAYEITGPEIEPSPTEPSLTKPPVRRSLFQSLIHTLSKAEITFTQTLALFIARYGAVFIYLLMALILSIVVLRKALVKKFKRKGFQQLDFIYSIQFLVALLISTYMLFGYAVEYQEIRIARFPLLMSTILGGLVVYGLAGRDSPQRANLDNLEPGKKAFIGLVAMLILATSVLSVLNVYYSPRVVKLNWQVTQMEITGTKWFSSHRDRNIGIAVANVPLGRFDDFNFGWETSPLQRAPRLKLIPSHFGYDENSSITVTFDFQDRYLLTCEAGRMWVMVVPESVKPEAHLYTEDDFARLRTDPAVAQIYANGEFEVWKVYGENKSG